MAVTAPPRRPARQSGSRKLLLALGAGPAGLLVLIVMIVVLLAGGVAVQQEQCGVGGQLPAEFTGPGSLGGIAGTGLTPAQIDSVRSGSPYAGTRVAAGGFVSTAYGPPWGGLQGAGQATSGGVILNGGAPRLYMIAVDPLVISHGTLVYVWPNPFGWRGPFLASDTGSAILSRRIDFYDWRGRSTQLGWGRRNVEVSAKPIKAGGPDVTVAAPLASGCGALVPTGPLGRRIGEIARSHLGSGPSIAGFQPPSIGVAWCAWFATNVWIKAGVPMTMSAASFWPYTWAQPRGLLFKSVGSPPRSVTPPAGAALMYGTGPASTATSAHVNLVDSVLRDGSFMVTGGNQDTSRVTRYGPCRLSRTDPAYLSGPGCDTRPIYGIALPGEEDRS